MLQLDDHTAPDGFGSRPELALKLNAESDPIVDEATRYVLPISTKKKWKYEKPDRELKLSFQLCLSGKNEWRQQTVFHEFFPNY